MHIGKNILLLPSLAWERSAWIDRDSVLKILQSTLLIGPLTLRASLSAFGFIGHLLT
jgi:hypothetical protein